MWTARIVAVGTPAIMEPNVYPNRTEILLATAPKNTMVDSASSVSFTNLITARVRSTTEGYSFTLLVCSLGGGSAGKGGSGPARGGVRSSWGGGQVQLSGGGGQVQLGGGVRSSCPGGCQVQLPWGGSGPAAGGVRSSCPGGVSQPGGSSSCALLRAVCLLHSRRRTFLFTDIFAINLE